ncbi:MAG: ABC transporter ATP-binding protein [Acutalibacter sp.]|nr:ABC transporter ATP-binding protein [Acutalibacter sp.]
MKKQAKNSNIKEYLSAFYKHNRLCFGTALLFSLLVIPVDLSLSWLLGAVTNVIGTGDMNELFRLLIFAAVLVFAGSGIYLIKLRTISVFIHRGLKQYKALAFQRLSQKSISAFTKENTGRYLSVLTNDVNTLEENYLSRFFEMIYLSVLFAATLIFMLWYSPLMTVITVVLSLLPMASSMALGGEMARRVKKVSDGNERFMAHLKDLLAGFSVLKSFKAETEVGALFEESNAEIEDLKLRRRWWESLLSVVAGYSCGFTMQIGIFFVGALLAIRGSVPIGTAIVFIQVSNYLIQAVQQVPQQYAARKAARGLIDKLSEVTEENTARRGDAIPPILRDSISLDRVTFGYDADTPVLKDLSLTLEAGKKYALVGASGSGKSTLMNLLMGAYDGYEGSISIDGKGLSTVDPDSLYDLISLIGQNVFLFDDTVLKNITMFKDFPAEQVRQAVERSGLESFLNERGQDYRCGENGVGLSGGERQRISIARALLRGTPVLLLDEATASLDNQTAFAVTDSILHLDGLTRLVVTHRLEEGLLEQYDEIFVLKDGTLKEQGRFKDLMEQKGYFYSLYTVSN